MIGCYITGILPRPKELIEATRAYERRCISNTELERAFQKATVDAINAQLSVGLTYVADGMLRWQDLLRPFTENLQGVKAGNLARWFNSNMFYRKPVISSTIQREKNIVEDMTYLKLMPKTSPWKAVLPAPYTFIELSQISCRMDKTELMFEYAKILREEILSLARIGFKYVQLSEPALVHKPTPTSTIKDKSNTIKEALRVAVEGIPIKTCLQTYFGDFSQILPEALNFPVDHLGVDLYETDLKKLKEYDLDKGIALGIVDSRTSMIEKRSDLTRVANEIINSIYSSTQTEVFICPNCDLEFVPWDVARQKIRVVADVVELLGGEDCG